MHKSNKVIKEGFHIQPRRLVQCLALAFAATAPMAGHAFDFDTGNTDLKLTWDNTVRYNGGWRMGNINQTFYNDMGLDETEGKFRRGDMVTNRLDLLTEFEATWKRDFGFRVSAAGWIDGAYSDKSDPNPALGGVSGNYANNNYNAYTKRFVRGPSGEFLDAFAFGKFELGSAQLNLKVGQHNVYWGDSLFSVTNSIAYSQGPVDTLKAATSPGAEAKELFMPLKQISMQLQVTPEISFGAQYLLDWKPFRLVPGGTFFAPSDGARSDYATPVGYAFAPGGNFFFGNGPDLVPASKHGDFGLNMRVTPSWLDGTFGVYYRRFDEKLPWAFLDVVGGGMAGPLGQSTSGAVRLNYARNVQLFGLSLNKGLGPVSVGSELSYRKNTALNSSLIVGIPSSGPAVSYTDAEGARGNTFHALVNGIYLLPETPLWVGGSLVAELSYQRLLSITNKPALFKGADNGCTDKRAGCATKDALSMAVNFTPEWPQAMAGWDLSAPMSISYGIQGNGAALGGSNEGAVAWSAGIAGKLHQVYEFSLKYIDSHARYAYTASGFSPSGPASQNNHNWLSFTFKTTF